MTNVTILRDAQGVRSFTVKGHSGYAEAGSDIVCSAVSALTQTAVLGLEELVGLPVKVKIGEGSLSCTLPQKTENGKREQAELILETMALGIRSIQETYGDYITITERKV